MDRLAPIAAIFLLSACSQGGNSGPQTGAVQVRVACPELDRSSGYLVTAEVGLDAAMCKLSPVQKSMPPAEVEIGNFPSAEPDLQFVGFTSSSVGQLAWFTAHGGAPSQAARWVTYIPTGSKFPQVMKLTVQGNSGPGFLQQQAKIADAVINASIGPNHSFEADGSAAAQLQR
jgi:hypothetical protein